MTHTDPPQIELAFSSPRLVAGVDEAGRGPLAGPVVAGAVILDPDAPIEGLADSKKLSERRRERLAAEIEQKALAWGLGFADEREIDEINILHASMLAMQRAVAELKVAPGLALVDGNRCPDLPCETRAIVGGDSTEAAISAASILAKVARDRYMLELDGRHPEYGFARHKGYPTAAHIEALGRHGPSPCHRLSFAPVRRAAGR
ncbi:MAG: ribonuclease HII [Gammaproteobacteria bacterium]